MHKSRLAGMIIDCQTDNLAKAANFWSQALGLPEKQDSETAEENYISLETGPNDLYIEIQKVNHPGRVHIDIETNDIEAEALRLEKLGARGIEKIKDWYIMEAPSGQRFCLVPPQRAEFDAEANEWP